MSDAFHYSRLDGRSREVQTARVVSVARPLLAGSRPQGEDMRKAIVLGVALSLVQVGLIALALVDEHTWGGASEDEAADVAVASDGSVYVTGTTLSFGAGGRDAFILTYAPDGRLEWQRATLMGRSSGRFCRGRNLAMAME
jgi:hypothetical protein